MAKASGVFEHIVGAAFDEFIAPTYLVRDDITPQQISEYRGEYIRATAADETEIARLEDLYGVTIL